MSPRRKYAPIERLRRGLLVLLLLLAAVVAAVYLRRERPTPTPRPSSEQLLAETRGGDVVLAGEGFEYQHTEEGRVVFFLRASQITSSREGAFRLRDVRVEVEREEGEAYVVLSDEAVYRIEESEAQLSGNVRVQSARGMELRSDRLDLVRGGSALESAGEVRFEMGDAYRGRSDKLTYHLGRERLRLEGKVRVASRRGLETEESGSLRADEVVIERQERLVRAQGSVELRRGDSVLTARRLSVTLAEDERTVEFVRAQWDVEGTLRPETGGDFRTTVVFAADQLSLAFADDEPQRVELESEKGRRPVRLDTRDDAGLERQIRAPYLTADFLAGEISLVRAYDGVTIDEALAFAPDDPVRAVCAQWVLVSFDEEEGGVEEMVLQNDVDYRQQGLQATGRRIDARPTGLELTGEPAVLRSDQGELEAPRIVWVEATGEVRAVQGVQAVFPGDGRFSLIGDGSGRLPIRLLAREAGWSEEPAEFRFSGEVRAWQGENYLLADRLVGDRDGDRLTASGRVKTVVRPRSQDPPEGGATERRPPVEVTAESLVYRRSERQVSYRQGVRAHETGRTMSCDEMDAWLGAGDRFERLVCSGQMVLENPADGHTLRGDRAVYEPGRGRVEVTGQPVVMTNRDGAELSGPVVIYDLDSGAAEVRASPTPRASN